MGNLVFKFNIQYTIWWWQLVSSHGWTPESITKLSWFVKIKFIYDTDCSIKCLGSVISWWSPSIQIEESALNGAPSVDVLISVHQAGESALKSLRIT